MRIVIPDQPSGRLGDAWRRCVGTGRFELALVEVTAVVDETPPWWDPSRLLGGER